MARSPIRSVLIAATLAAIVGSTTTAAAQPSVTMDSSLAERRERESIETQSHTATALYVVSVVELIGSPTLALFGLAQGVGCVFGGGDRCSAMDALYVSSVVSGVLGLVTLGIAVALDVDTTARAHRLRLGMRTSSSPGCSRYRARSEAHPAQPTLGARAGITRAARACSSVRGASA